MIKALLTSLFLISIMTVCVAKDIKVTIVTTSNSNDNTSLSINGAFVKSLSETQGQVVYAVKISDAAYASLGNSYKLFLESGKDLLVKIDKNKISFEGKNAAENVYLNSSDLNQYYTKLEMGLMMKTSSSEQVIQTLRDREDLKRFGKVFSNFETKKADFRFIKGRWSEVKKDSAFYASNFTEQPEYFETSEYRDFMRAAIFFLSGANSNLNTDYNSIMAQVKYVATKIKSPSIREFYIQQLAMDYIRTKGIDNAEEMIALHRQHVTSKQPMEIFQKEYDKWAAIKKGAALPTFSYMDINDKTVKPEDLKGKYVYIDFWATWCGPCKKEIPDLEKLTKLFEGKNIHFVSISIDEHKDKWREMVKSENLGGIQLHADGIKLHAGPSNELMKLLMVTSIPRFVLLDREGRILNASMTRPSDAETAKTLQKLEGI